MEQRIPVPESLSIAPISPGDLRTCEAWRIAFAGQRKDHRYYEIIADTIRDHFDYGYLAIRDASGRVLAVQPYFLLDQDVLEGIKIDRSSLVARLRRRCAPSMPMTTLDIDYDSFDDYMQKALSAKTRRDLRKKFRDAESSCLKMTVTDNAASFIDELYPLYLQTYERSNFHFEKLTKDYFRRLGCEMSDKTRFFIWYRGNTLVAFALCMVEGDEIFAEYVGLDYDFALDFHLYHYITRDVISWAMTHGYKRFRSSGLNYDPKLHLGHRLDPIDLYARHVSPIANWIIWLMLPWIVPVRYDATLRKFADYRQMW
jgi:hypothetical protein